MEERNPKQPEQETLIATLFDLPRYKLHLIKYEFGGDRHFILRRMKFLAPDNVKGNEILIDEHGAQILVDELAAALKTPRLPAEAPTPIQTPSAQKDQAA